METIPQVPNIFQIIAGGAECKPLRLLTHSASEWIRVTFYSSLRITVYVAVVTVWWILTDVSEESAATTLRFEE